MDREQLLSPISVDPNVCFGKPCIRGHRIWVSLILDLLASGATIEQILDEDAGLEDADVRACIAYGAEMARERARRPPGGRAPVSRIRHRGRPSSANTGRRRMSSVGSSARGGTGALLD